MRGLHGIGYKLRTVPGDGKLSVMFLLCHLFLLPVTLLMTQTEAKLELGARCRRAQQTSGVKGTGRRKPDKGEAGDHNFCLFFASTACGWRAVPRKAT